MSVMFIEKIKTDVGKEKKRKFCVEIVHRYHIRFVGMSNFYQFDVDFKYRRNVKSRTN